MYYLAKWNFFFAAGLFLHFQVALADPPTSSCTSSTYGGMLYDSGTSSMFLCNPAGWGGVGGWVVKGGAIYPTTPAFNVGIGNTAPAAKLDVSGEIKIGSSGAACTSTLAGSVRYSGGKIQSCDGTAWKNVSITIDQSNCQDISVNNCEYAMCTCPEGWYMVGTHFSVRSSRNGSVYLGGAIRCCQATL